MEKEKKLYIDIENVKHLMQERNLDINTVTPMDLAVVMDLMAHLE